MPVNDYTDVEARWDEGTNGVHVTHFIGIDGRDIRVRVCFDADDHATVTAATAPGMSADVFVIEYEGEDPIFDPLDLKGT